MKICHNCKAEQPTEQASTCMYCGFELKNNNEAIVNNNEPLNKDDFDNIGNDTLKIDLNEAIDIQSNSDFMQQESTFNPNISDNDQNHEFSPIGDSAPPLPEQNLNIPTHDKKEDNGNGNGNGIKKLSDDEVKSIEANLYSKNAYLTDREKDDLMSKIDQIEDKPFNNNPIKPPHHKDKINNNLTIPKSELPKPKISPKGRGVAYFYKNYIKLSSKQPLTTGDELIVNDKAYTLKPKDFGKRIVISAAAFVSLIAIIFISIFMGQSPIGYGQMSGVVLDDNDRPYISGATIRLPDEGKSVKSNAQGFFLFKAVSSGTHKIQYLIDNKIIKEDYATITANNQSLIFLRPEPPKNQIVQKKQTSKPVAVAPKKKVQKAKATPPKPASVKTVAKKTTTKTSGTAKLTLAANVQGAKLTLDGKVLGAGNLTYKRIRPGKHKYTVSVDGYSTAEGSFTVNSGENKKLAVTLKPLKAEEKYDSYGTDDYFYSGSNALKEGDYKTAISDFTQVIETQPGNGEAYYKRGEAYKKTKYNSEAVDDFVRAAEIYQFNKKHNKALRSYSNAIDINDKSIASYLGRANLYLKKGENLAAMADFDAVKKIDKRNYDAYFGLGKAAFKQQRFNKAIKHFKDARSINDKKPLVHQYLMLAYLADNDLKNVKKCFSKFEDIATEDDMRNFITSKKYTAVLKIIEMDK